MSLINDALKRAGQNSAQPAAPPPPSVPVAMCPVEKATSRGLPKYFLPLAVVIFCAALVILFKGFTDHKPINAVARPPVVAARAPAAAPTQAATRPTTPSSTTSPVATPIRSAANSASNLARTQAAPSRAATTPTSAVPVSAAARATTPVFAAGPSTPRAVAASAPPAQTYKLGGIFFRATNPSAVINNRTVFVGERVGNARVKSITRDTVALEFPGGQLLELTL